MFISRVFLIGQPPGLGFHGETESCPGRRRTVYARAAMMRPTPIGAKPCSHQKMMWRLHGVGARLPVVSPGGGSKLARPHADGDGRWMVATAGVHLASALGGGVFFSITNVSSLILCTCTFESQEVCKTNNVQNKNRGYQGTEIYIVNLKI